MLVSDEIRHHDSTIDLEVVSIIGDVLRDDLRWRAASREKEDEDEKEKGLKSIHDLVLSREKEKVRG